MAALRRVNVSTPRLRVDNPDIRHSEFEVVVDFFFQIAGAIVRRKNLHSDYWRFTNDPLGRLGTWHYCDVRNPEARLLYLDAYFHTGPDALFVMRSQVVQDRTLHIAV